MSDQAHVIAQVETPLGPVLLHLADADRVSATVSIAQARPELPAGMRVDRAVRIDLRMRAETDVAPLQFAVVLDASHEGSPETGEWLDSIRFNVDGTQLSLATRDASWMLTYGVDGKFLPSRLRTDPATADFSSWAVRYTPQGFLIEVAQLRRGEILICPLAAAYASSQPDSHSDESTWFAVDYALP